MVTVFFVDGPLAGHTRNYGRYPDTVLQPVAIGATGGISQHLYQVDAVEGLASQVQMWIGQGSIFERAKVFGPGRKELMDITYDDDRAVLDEFMKHLAALTASLDVWWEPGYEDGEWTRGHARDYHC